MNNEISNQLLSFMIFFISGCIIGIFFDIFRIIRKCFKISDIRTYIEDITFGLITGTFLIILIFVYNNGYIRLYMFIALFFGLLIYLKTISKYFILINVIIVRTFIKILKFIIHILLIPFSIAYKFIIKIIEKPVRKLTKSINIIESTIGNKFKNYIVIKHGKNGNTKCRKK